MCDIDYFKSYNDTYGHLAGDDCIKIVADSISQHCMRVSDVAARYGGEEFAVILPNTNAEDAQAIAETIRRGIELKKIPHESSSIKSIVSISVGVSTIIPLISTVVTEIISCADEALYESKSSGRDKVSFKGM
jgi:diguanylate cyclase (GGDEF)-like protein